MARRFHRLDTNRGGLESNAFGRSDRKSRSRASRAKQPATTLRVRSGLDPANAATHRPQEPMRLAAFMLLAPALIGCTHSNRPSASHPTSAEWTLGDFRVRFEAGPRAEEGGSHSCYRISHKAAGQEEREHVMESAHSLGGFGCVTNGDPRNWIRIVEDPSTRALLIEEEIPNDCGPCSNHLWVHLDARGLISGSYLRLPSRVTGPPGGIDYEYPKVRSLDGNILRYGYSVGAAVTERIDRIEKADRPTPPG